MQRPTQPTPAPEPACAELSRGVVGLFIKTQSHGQKTGWCSSTDSGGIGVHLYELNLPSLGHHCVLGSGWLSL